ncbi:MAG: WD40 repeat domain-containing protein [Treponema sp.]|nr:WD40 repeat domain-containing protein [Treponema sp.]
MAQKKQKIKYIIVILIFIVYFLIAARPVPKEIILAPNWISSLGGISSEGVSGEYSVPAGEIEPELHILSESSDLPRGMENNFLPFTLGSRFGFIHASGQFVINRVKSNDIYLSRNMWTEYSAEPSNIVINNINTGSEINIENPGGYPILLDNRVFILGSDQNSLSEIDNGGSIRWTYEFGAPLTAIDAAAGLVVTGSLDGAVEVFNSEGERIFYIEPSGSRYSVILGCAISRNGSRIGIICGIDQQRFLLFESLGNDGDYKIVYHEFLDAGFRRPVRVSFIDDDQRIVYERMGGIGCYNIRSRHGINIPLDGEIAAIDESGEDGFLFVVTSHGEQGDSLSNRQQMKLVGIRFPPDRRIEFSRTAPQDTIFIKASFKSDDVFLGRMRTAGSVQGSGLRDNSMLIAGGGEALISFVLEEK